jgi:hypothetical protein
MALMYMTKEDFLILVECNTITREISIVSNAKTLLPFGPGNKVVILFTAGWIISDEGFTVSQSCEFHEVKS